VVMALRSRTLDYDSSLVRDGQAPEYSDAVTVDSADFSVYLNLASPSLAATVPG
jgi:hypothetical protein